MFLRSAYVTKVKSIPSSILTCTSRAFVPVLAKIIISLLRLSLAVVQGQNYWVPSENQNSLQWFPSLLTITREAAHHLQKLQLGYKARIMGH